MVKMEDIRYYERLVNGMLEKVEVHVGGRYGYYAIDLYDKDGGMVDTVRTGMSKKEAYDCLVVMEGILRREQ